MVVFPPGAVFLAPLGGGGHMMPLPGVGGTSSWCRARHGLDSLLFHLFVIVILFHYYFCFYWLGVVIGRVGCFIMCAISPA